MIADNLGWFRKEKVNIETLMKEKGRKIYRFANKETMEFLMGDKKPENFEEVELP